MLCIQFILTHKVVYIQYLSTSILIIHLQSIILKIYTLAVSNLQQECFFVSSREIQTKSKCCSKRVVVVVKNST